MSSSPLILGPIHRFGDPKTKRSRIQSNVTLGGALFTCWHSVDICWRGIWYDGYDLMIKDISWKHIFYIILSLQRPPPKKTSRCIILPYDNYLKCCSQGSGMIPRCRRMVFATDVPKGKWGDPGTLGCWDHLKFGLTLERIGWSYLLIYWIFGPNNHSMFRLTIVIAFVPTYQYGL